MPKAEQKLAALAAKYLPHLAFLLAMGLSLYARVRWLPVVGADMSGFLLPWTQQLAAGGLSAIAGGVGNHSVLLQYLYWLAEVMPLPTVQAIKLFSVSCDYLMALAVALLVLRLRPRPVDFLGARLRPELLVFALAALLPLPLLNSAYWGQSDSLYVCPALFALYFLLRRRWLPAFLLFGLAFSVKLQAIFLLPVFIMAYFMWRKFSALYFLLVPGVLVLSTLPVVAAGGSPLLGLRIYLGQAGEAVGYYVNYPGLPALTHNWHNELFVGPATALAVLVLLAMLAWLVAGHRQVRGQNLVLLAAWCALACVCLLPGMHERYGYLGEVLLWAWFCMAPGLKRFCTAAIFTFTGYCAYSSFLLGNTILPEALVAIINLLALGYLTRLVLRSLPPGRAPAAAMAGRAPEKDAPGKDAEPGKAPEE